MKQLSFILIILFIGLSQFGFSQTEWKSETFHGTLKGMSFTATIEYRVDCEHATPFVRATLKDIEVYKYEYEGETYQYGYDLPITADEGFLVLDGKITLVKGGDFNRTFELNEKHLSTKIGGGGNAMTADEFRFTNESEVTKIMGVNSCSGALEKLEYTTAILEITSVDIAKYDGDLRLNGRAINDLLKEKINESASSKSNSDSSRSYLEEAKEEKNEYMEQLDREERMEQNRRSESERELNRIKQSNQDPTIKTIEVVEHEMGKVTDSFNASIDRQIAEDRRKQELAIRKEEEEERLENQRLREREKRVDAYWKHSDERGKLIDPIRNEVYTFAVDYDKADRKFYNAFSNAIRDSKSEIFILPIFQRGKMDFDTETYEIYEEMKYYLKSFTPIRIDLSKYDTIKFASARAVYDWPKTIKAELENQGFKKTWHKELVFMYGTDEGALLENVQSIVRKYDRSILVYEHNKIDVEIIEKRIYEEYLNEIEQVKREKEELRERNEAEAAFEVALQKNTIRSYNEYLENPNYTHYKDKALEKVAYLKFLEIVNSENFDALANAYIENNPDDAYAKRLKLIMEFKHVKSIKLTGHLNGECYVKSQEEYIKAKSKEEAISIIEHCVKLEKLHVEVFHTSKPTEVDLSLLKDLVSIELDAFNPNVSYKNVNAINTLKIQGSSDSEGSGYFGLKSHLKDFSHLTSLQNLELFLINNNDSSHIIEILSNNQNLIDLTIDHVGTDYDGYNWIYNDYMDRAMEKVADLTRLKRLKVNKSVGTLPDNIGNLIELEVLDLSENDIEIMPNSIGELNKLRELNLHYNKLKNIPPSIGNLSKLEKLNLSLNNFRKLPAEFCNLTKLQSLEIGSPSLRSLPVNFGNLQGLEELDLSSSRNIYSLPESFVELVNLKKLNVSLGTLEGNRAKEVKSSIKKLKKKNPNMVTVK